MTAKLSFAFALWLLPVAAVCAQPFVLERAPCLDGSAAPVAPGLWRGPLTAPDVSTSRTPRLDLLGLPTGFLQNPVGEDDPTIPGPEESILISLGNYNPYLGWR